MNSQTWDAAIIGAGPTGLVAANLLGAAGLRILLVERNPSTVQQPRAVSIDDESLRTMQTLGLLPALMADIAPDYGSHYLTASGTCFLKVEPATREFGHPRRSAFLQPKLEAGLRDGLARFPSVTTCFGTECVAVAEDSEGVAISLRDADDTTRDVRARYVIGSDGGRSMLRRTIGATLGGATYQQRWLIVDLAETVELFRQTRVLCNPARPAICLPGPHGTRRYEFMLHDHETDDLAQSDAFVTRLLAANGPDAGARVVRQQVYAFHARMVDRWATARIFLAGDAAHLTPPFAGQGMNSGVRDAHNIAWKLIAVLRDGLDPALLRSYATERPPHAWALIQLAVKMGRVMMPRTPLRAWAIQTGFRLARLVPRVQDYFAQMKYKPKPFYQSGCLDAGSEAGIVGRMLPQPLLDMTEGGTRLMDDVIGPGFALLALGRAAVAIAARVDAGAFGLPDPALLAITPRRWNPGWGDLPCRVGRDIEDRLAGLGADEGMLLVLRPDRYVALATRDVTEAGIASLATRCRGLLRPSSAAPG